MRSLLVPPGATRSALALAFISRAVSAVVRGFISAVGRGATDRTKLPNAKSLSLLTNLKPERRAVG